jgi:DNA-binding NtrC family response regulator
MPQERRSKLAEFLAHNGMDVATAESLLEAQRKLGGLPHCDLVCADAELRDGSWRELLEFLLSTHKHCEMVVCSRLADEQLWAEVIQCGAFDLIPEPWDRNEVLRIIRSALESHYTDRFSRGVQRAG